MTLNIFSSKGRMINTIWINKNEIKKRIKKELLKNYLEQGFFIGRSA